MDTAHIHIQTPHPPPLPSHRCDKPIRPCVPHGWLISVCHCTDTSAQTDFRWRLMAHSGPYTHTHVRCRKKTSETFSTRAQPLVVYAYAPRSIILKREKEKKIHRHGHTHVCRWVGAGVLWVVVYTARAAARASHSAHIIAFIFPCPSCVPQRVSVDCSAFAYTHRTFTSSQNHGRVVHSVRVLLSGGQQRGLQHYHRCESTRHICTSTHTHITHNKLHLQSAQPRVSLSLSVRASHVYC